MTWTRLSDDFCEDERIVNLSDGAFRLHVAGLIYSNKRLLDGYVPRGAVGMLVPKYRPAFVRELTGGDRPLWRAKPGGYQIEDFEKDQLTRAQVERIHKARAEAGQVGGMHSGETRRRGSKQSGSNDEANASANWNPVSRTPFPVSRSGNEAAVSETKPPRHIGDTATRVTESLRG